MDESKLMSMPQLKSTSVHIVKAEWFWTSVQHEYRQLELDFKIDDVSISHSDSYEFAESIQEVSCTYRKILE